MAGNLSDSVVVFTILWYIPECYTLCLQEHWLLQEHLDSLSAVKEFDFLYVAVSGVDSSK